MAADTMPIRRIADGHERTILIRFAQGHNAVRIAAGLGLNTQGVSTLLGQVCGWDRGRAAQQVRAYDAAQRHQTRPSSAVAPPPPVHRGRPPNPDTVGKLQAHIRDLKTQLADATRPAPDARITELETDNADLRTRLDGLATQADATQRQLLADLRAARKNLADTHLQMLNAQEGAKTAQLELARATKQLNALADAADYKARLDRLRELVDWASEDNGALITIAAVRQALDGDGGQP